jgi:uncharacterized protein YjbI with pentapeptide repeats
MEAFEPPKYIRRLIAAVNDGAKSAQLGALAFTAIGLFLLATAVSAPDEDLLLNRALTISQLGNTAVPVVFAFGLAPLVFVAVHFYTLIRYDMLAGNIRRFVKDLATMVPIEADRDRCRQLLANVEFVNAQAMPKGSRASSWMFRGTVWVLLAGFPILVLLIVQLQSLRLQNEWITRPHQACIVLDLVLLVWFFGRLHGDDRWHFWGAPIRRKVALCWLPVAVLTVALLWLEVPRPTSKTVGQDLTGYLSQYPKAPASFMDRVGWVVSFQPIDLLFCHPSAWGCRFLTVTHHVITGKVWDTATFVALRAGADLDAKHLASFEVAQLAHRTLRFADLTGSELFAAHLTGAHLNGANLADANLTGAYLNGAHLNGAYLDRANLSGANLLDGADLTGAYLYSANLTGAYLTDANLAGAHLNYANLTGAYLTGAHLTGASLTYANLSGAYLTGADLTGAYLGPHLTGAQLAGANLTRANLNGSDLTGADLRGADLKDTNLNGANLNGANLTGARNLIQAQLDEACGTDTKLPPGLTLNKPCPSPVK